jgi:DNA modification methylase
MLSEIILGNCLDILPTLELDYNRVVFVSDPPYNVSYNYNSYSDNMKEGDYMKFLKEVFYREYNGNMIPHVILHYPESLHRYSIEIGIPPVKEITWVFNNHLPKQHRSICYYGIKPNLRQVPGEYKNPNDKRVKGMIEQGKHPPMYDWIECQQVKNVSKEKVDHPCQIPISLMERIIGVLPKDSIIIDPFSGSGSTGIACANLNVDFIGIELDEKYYEISKDRLECYKIK